ncbi:MAG: hypothetical protein AB8G95_08705, partial [Anaerolineae bacterium]
ETVNWNCLKNGSKLKDAVFLAQKVDFHARNILKLDWAGKHLFVEDKFAKLKRRIQMKTNNTPASAIATGKLGQVAQRPPQTAWNKQLWKINDAAALDYEPGEYDGYMLQIRPIQGYRKYDHPGINFELVNKTNLHYEQLDVYPAGMMVEPFVKQLAQVVSKHIKKVS